MRSQRARVLQLVVEIILALVIIDLLTGFVSLLLAARILNPVDLRGRWLSGKHAIDCGVVQPREERKAANDYVLKAQAQGQAFRVRYDSTGIDNRSSVGIVRTPNGALYEIFYPWTFPDVGSSLLLKGVRVRPCPTPAHLFVNPRGQADCFEWH